MMRSEARVRAVRAWLVEMTHTAAARGELDLVYLLQNHVENMDWVLGVESQLDSMLPDESVLVEMETKLNAFEQQGFDEAKNMARRGPGAPGGVQ
jgi:hypothetical protein